MQPGGMRYPLEMGVADVEAFLSMLANDMLAGLLPHGRYDCATGAGAAASPLDSMLQV